MDPRFFRSRAEFRSWLDRNHAKASEQWVGFYKKSAGRSGMGYEEAVEEALCFGWIDGVTRSLDDQRWTIRFTPRTKRSNWSPTNIARFEALRAAGRVTPAGYEAFDRRDFTRSEPPTRLAPAYAARLKADRRARTFWEAASPSYRKAASSWVMSAVRAETKERRLALLIEHSRRGERVPPLSS